MASSGSGWSWMTVRNLRINSEVLKKVIESQATLTQVYEAVILILFIEEKT